MGLSPVEVGGRVHVEGEFGTILYIGSIEGVEGTWLGVEWDNISRGKHSGCYNNISYFKTKIPNAGSFIRISKADLGITLPQAVKLKYGNESNSSITPTYINLPQKGGPERHIEMIGMKKIMGKLSNFSLLKDVVLSNMLINGLGNENELKEMIPSVKHLDLCQNLISSWTIINEIVKQLAELTTLILSKNRLQIPESSEYQECYKSVKTLVLNDMAYSWKEILTCAVMWPNIEDLSVQHNKISVLESPPDTVFSNLRLLNLNNNNIENWMEICKLGKLQSLKELYLDNVGLEFIDFPDVLPSEKTKLFSNLQILFLSNNNLKKWDDVGELNKLMSLTDLLINNNPIYNSENPETVRQFVIAKILGLRKLNRMEVEKSERRGAEFDYIKKFYKDWLSDDCSKNINQDTDQNSSPFLKLHPTYSALLLKHGVPDENEINVKSTLIKDSLISVRFVYPLFPDKPPLIKRLPGEMTVGKMKALVKRIFKEVPTHNFTLSIIYNEDESQKTELDNNLRQLSFYSLSEKDKIVVEW